ncbi:MAG: hypothetical protein JHC93_04375 [Parachlamydiales bacterium]|nr:hypothetical protein [Parachlamydiales bacterium]
MSVSVLNLLKKESKVLADSADKDAITPYSIDGITTNPTIICRGLSSNWLKDEPSIQNKSFEEIAVWIGSHLATLTSGQISTQIDPHCAFDIDETIKKSCQIIEMYQKQGVDASRILVKIPATLEGLKAAQKLEKDGIACNMTLVFHPTQAILAADFGIHCVAPYVGRVTAWFQTHDKSNTSDVGSLQVAQLKKYFLKNNYKTKIMAASFRSCEQILSLRGCDELTMAPKFLQELSQYSQELPPRLIDTIEYKDFKKIKNDSDFRFLFNESAMAVEKLCEGLRLFCKDTLIISQQ